ncbi:hypothetical protein B0H14DRAFT_3010541 [Mycena olivaceomarginata]|nr:hypothetical protein B0H14DRAFT_3010541 [Mycena olivaceomarginata]
MPARAVASAWRASVASASAVTTSRGRGAAIPAVSRRPTRGRTVPAPAAAVPWRPTWRGAVVLLLVTTVGHRIVQVESRVGGMGGGWGRDV